MADKPIAVPAGSHPLSVHLAVSDAMAAIKFYQKAFGAQLMFVHKMPNGKVMHASLRIGDSSIMLADEFPGGTPSPAKLGGSPVVLNLLVNDVDSLWNQALAAGAEVRFPLANQFWGDRYGHVIDPFGHTWALLSHVENVPPEEMERRANAVFAQMSKGHGG